MVGYELNCAPKLTEEQLEQLEQAEKMPVVYDEDSPRLTPEMVAAFQEVRRKKPVHSETLTLSVSSATLERAKSFGEDYLSLMGKLLDKAVAEYRPT